jgi:hypothetical protein
MSYLLSRFKDFRKINEGVVTFDNSFQELLVDIKRDYPELSVLIKDILSTNEDFFEKGWLQKITLDSKVGYLSYYPKGKIRYTAPAVSFRGEDRLPFKDNTVVEITGIEYHPQTYRRMALVKDNTGRVLPYSMNKLGQETIGRPIRVKTGSFIKDLLKISNQDKHPGHIIEKLVNTLNSFQVSVKDFQIIQGDDIWLYYREENLAEGTGTLQDSCLIDKDKNFFNLFSKNPDKVKLCILQDSEGLQAKAFVWELDSGKTYMDRTYYTHPYQSVLLESHARDNGWYLNLDSEERVTIDIGQPPFPSLDTFRFYDTKGGFLSNHSKPGRFLLKHEPPWTEKQ